jgi:predicted CXXCH cytochrome family protein
MSREPLITKRTSNRRPVLFTTGLLLLGGLAVCAYLISRAVPVSLKPSALVAQHPDPRQTYTGPYRNIGPDIAYVGDAQCAGCHEAIAKSFARHPMGRSLVPIADLLDQQDYSRDANNPFTALGRRFFVDRADHALWHRQTALEDAGKPIIELAQQVDWVIGSGAKGRSYLTERDGYLFQTPISWFTHKQRWDLSPGFDPSALSGRLVTGACLFCHANRLREDPDSPDHFTAPVFEGCAIGCERCHGPGQLHGNGDLDHTIVNPARLSPVLRDAVCEQCHLEGDARILRSGRGLFDYRPGLPLNDFWAVLIPARRGDDAKAVNHVEQMHQSQCYQRTAGAAKLGCISCHDPHVMVEPAEREVHYRAACLKCHDGAVGQRACSAPLAQRLQTNPQDSCITCHMPRYAHSDIAHAASTDHRIERRPGNNLPDAIHLEAAEFVDFYGDSYPAGDPQAERTLGMGLVKLISTGLLRPERRGEQALLLLESAIANDPADVELRESKVQLLLLLGRHSEALTEASPLLEARPRDWRLLAWAATAAQAEGQTDSAIDYWRRTVEINPFMPEYQANLIDLLMRTGKQDEAKARCAKLLQLDPFNGAGRQAWNALKSTP